MQVLRGFLKGGPAAGSLGPYNVADHKRGHVYRGGRGIYNQKNKRCGSSMKRFDVTDIAWQVKAMMKHDIFRQFDGSKEKTAKIIRAETLVIVSQQDQIVYPSPAIEFAEILKARTLILKENSGHMSVIYEMDKIIPVLSSFLEE